MIVSLLSGETVPTKNLKFKNLLGYNFHFKTPSKEPTSPQIFNRFLFSKNIGREENTAGKKIKSRF